MENQLTLEKALVFLDADNDSHWTKTGLPKLKALKDITGNDELTSAEVKEAIGGDRRRPVVEEPKLIHPDDEVIVMCTVGNIWTTRGKLLRGQSIMLKPSEAAMIEGMMAERNKSKLEA